MTAVISNIVRFIGEKPYLEKKIVVNTILGPAKEAKNGVELLYKIGATRETRLLDFLAGRLLIAVEEKMQKSIDTDIPVRFSKRVDLNIKKLDFEKGEIQYSEAKSPGRTLSAPMPEDMWDRQVLVKGINLRWWSVLKAVAVYYFNSGLEGQIVLMPDSLSEFVLEKSNIYIQGTKILPFASNEVSIKGRDVEAKVLIKGKDEDIFRISIRYVDTSSDKIYLGIGFLTEGNKYHFMTKTISDTGNAIRFHYHFKYGEDKGIACKWQDSCFLYDGIKVEGDIAKILLGRDIFLKVERVENAYNRGEYILQFVLFANQSRQVKGLSMFHISGDLGKLLFRRMMEKYK